MTKGGLYDNADAWTQRERGAGAIEREAVDLPLRCWVEDGNREESRMEQVKDMHISPWSLPFSMYGCIYGITNTQAFTFDFECASCIFNELCKDVICHYICTVHNAHYLKTEKLWRSWSVCDKENHFYVCCTTY